jgi:hypothetical protein
MNSKRKRGRRICNLILCSRIIVLQRFARMFVSGGRTMMKSVFLICSLGLALAAGAHAATPPATQAPATVTRFLGSENSPYSAATAGEFANACKTDPSSCAAMVGQVLMDRIQFSPTSHICLPGVTYANAVGPWLAVHPEAAQMRTGDGIYLALTTIYKCGAPTNY